MDNRTMSIGTKRTRLFSAASGEYTCIIDDDDDVVDDFVPTLRNVITRYNTVDVICYNQTAMFGGKQWTIKTSLEHNKEYPFDQFVSDANGNPTDCKRPPWHWCAWKTEFARKIPFGDSNWHEDAMFVIQAAKLAKTQFVLNKTMCTYTESNPGHNPNIDMRTLSHVQMRNETNP